MAGKLEAAFDADRAADPESWTWTDLTDLTEENAAAISRGRPSSRGQIAEPASATFPLRNGDGDTVSIGSLTPRKATGDWYPNVRRGLPLRYYQNVGASTLALTGIAGSRASTPDAASWAISPDIAMAVQFRAPLRLSPTNGTSMEVVGQFNTTGNQRAWLFYLGSSGRAFLRISSDGTAESNSNTTLAIPNPDAGPLTVACEFDGDNGAGGNTTTWYVLKGTITELLADKTAYLFGDPDINAGTLTIHNSTGTPSIGDVAGSGFDPYRGCIDRVYVRGGTLTSGTVVADADFTAEAAGTTSFVDDAGTPKTWTLADSTITDRKIRLLGEYGGNRGDYPGQGAAGTARRTITVAGPLRRMRQGAKPLQSALHRRITAPVGDTTVRDYYSLEDGRDATSLYPAIGGSTGAILTASLASDDTLAASRALPNVGGGSPYGWNIPLSRTTSATTWEYTMFVNIPVAPDAGAGEYLDLQRIDTIGGVLSGWVLRADDTNMQVFAKDADGANILNGAADGATVPSDARFFDTWMIVTLSVGLSGANITWRLDLIPIPLGLTFTDSGTIPSLGLAAGGPSRLRCLMSSAPQEGFSFGHFTVTEGAVVGWLAPADTAYVGEPDTSRVFRLCREQGIPVAVDGPNGTDWAAALAAGAQPMGPQRPLALMALLEECAVVGRGYLGELRELLGISYRSGITLANQTPRLTVTTEVTSPFVSNDDDQGYVNEATVSRPLGSQSTYTAAGGADPLIGTPYDHPDDAGLYDAAEERNVELDADTVHQASWWVHETTWPEERHDTVPLDIPTTSTAQLAAFHDMSVGDVVAATALPDATESESLSQLVDGWVETDSPFLWSVRPNTRPAGPHNVGTLDALVASPDTDLARLTSRDTTTAEALDTTETGVDVAFTSTRWVTTAGEPAFFPFDIMIGGERMTVTACTATTSPQTFTVTRSVNGVVKSHATGALVELAEPLRLRM